MNQILRADISDMAEIRDLQKLAYQTEAILYNDWTIPPLTQTINLKMNQLELEFAFTF